MQGEVVIDRIGELIVELAAKYGEFNTIDARLKEIGDQLASIGSELNGNLVDYETPSYPSADEVRKLVEAFRSAGDDLNELRAELAEKTGLVVVPKQGSRLLPTTEDSQL